MIFSNNSDRDPWKAMTRDYNLYIDFTDRRFLFIPGDISELLIEMETMYPRMNALALGECPAANAIMELDFVRSRLTHLIDHAQSLKDSLFALMAVRRAMDNNQEREGEGG